MLRRTLASPALSLALSLTSFHAAAVGVGDRVEAYNYGWSAGTVVQIGSGDYAGYFLVKRDDSKIPQWTRADNVKPASAAAEKKAAEDAAKRNQTFQVGQRVMGYNYGWSAGTVMQMGTGDMAGYFLVKRDDFPKSPQWYRADNLKTMDEVHKEHGREAADLARGPRPGRYGIWSYGAPGAIPLYFGEFELQAGGRYRAWRAGKVLAGSGTWRYDAASRTVTWLSGPYREQWEGRFEVRAAGKIHSVYLKRNVVASNSL